LHDPIRLRQERADAEHPADGSGDGGKRSEFIHLVSCPAQK
jgi:hypothetical protein